MRVDSYVFDGLEATCSGIRGLAPELAYFVLRDLSVSGKEIQLERLDFEPPRLAPFMEQTPPQRPSPDLTDDAEPIELDEDDVDDSEDSDDSDDSEDDDASEQQPTGPERGYGQTAGIEFDHPSMLEGVCCWVVQASQRIGITAPVIHLRVQAYAQKGSKVVFTSSYWCRNEGYRADYAEMARKAGLERLAREAGTSSPMPPTLNSSSAPAAELVQVASVPSPVSAPTQVPVVSPVPGHAAHPVPAAPPDMLIYPAGYQDGTLFGTVGAFRALNESYVQFGDALMGGVSSLQSMMNQLLEARGDELVNCRGQVDKLITDILDHRLKEVEARTHAVDAQVQDNRTALVRDALNQIGETSRAFFVSRGVPPEMADLMATFSSNPELMSALEDPVVKEVLKDPTNQQALIIMLRQVGQRQQAMKAQAGPSVPPSTGMGGQAPAGGFSQPPQPHLYNTSPPQPQNGGYPPPNGQYASGFAGGFPGSQPGAYPPPLNYPSYPGMQPGPYPAPAAYGPPATTYQPQTQYSNPAPMPGPPQGYPPAQQPGPMPGSQGQAPYPYPGQQPGPYPAPQGQSPHPYPGQQGPYPGQMPGQPPYSSPNQARAYPGTAWPMGPGTGAGVAPGSGSPLGPSGDPAQSQAGAGQPPPSGPSPTGAPPWSGESLDGSPKSS